MSSQPFQTFISLINLDQDIQKIKNQIEEINREIGQIQEQKDQIAHEIDACHEQLNQLRKSVDMHELELQTLADQEKNLQDRMDSSVKYKELSSMKNEVDHLRRVELMEEDQLISSLNRYESSQKSYEKTKENGTLTIRSLAQNQDDKKKIIDELQENADKLTQKRAEFIDQIPADWLEKYTTMRARVSDPVVPVQSDCCGACFFSIPNHELARINRGALLQCKHCFRLLYSPDFFAGQLQRNQPNQS